MSTANFSRSNLSKVYAIGMERDEEDYYEEEIDDSIDYVVGLMDEQFTNFIKERENTWLGRHTRELGHWSFDYFDKSYKEWDSFRIKFVVESGYYQGAKFDLDFSDRQGIDLSKTMEKRIDALVRKVEKILDKVTTPLAVYARFSNGETWYKKA